MLLVVTNLVWTNLLLAGTKLEWTNLVLWVD